VSAVTHIARPHDEDDDVLGAELELGKRSSQNNRNRSSNSNNGHSINKSLSSRQGSHFLSSFPWPMMRSRPSSNNNHDLELGLLPSPVTAAVRPNNASRPTTPTHNHFPVADVTTATVEDFAQPATATST
jgi:hypothetical protein